MVNILAVLMTLIGTVFLSIGAAGTAAAAPKDPPSGSSNTGNATAASSSAKGKDALVAELTIYADGSDIGNGSSGWVSGHAFLGVKNISTSNITVGKLAKVAPQQTVTLGTWGNKAEHVGLWYNLEAYFIHGNSSIYATTSYTRGITSKELQTLNDYVVSHDSHGGDGIGAAANNCATFAAGAWNKVVPFGFEVFAGFPAQTPTVLALSIGALPGAQYGASVNIPWNLLGVWHANGKKPLVPSKVFVTGATKLTFDDFPLTTSITNQYAHDGLLISGAPGPVISGDGSNPTAPVLSPGPGYVGTIDLQFVSPKDTSKSATASAVAFDIGYMNVDSGASVSWYSKTGKLLGQRSTTGTGIVQIGIDSPSVYRVHIDTTADPAGAAIDNLQFSLN